MGKKGAAPSTDQNEVEEQPEETEPPGEQLDGDFTFPDGSEYSGQYFKKGDEISLHGNGRLLSGPEVFQGTFERGQYKMGKFKSCNGAVYVGHFRNNLFHGPGEYCWPDGKKKYKGMWKMGCMHGHGLFDNFSFGVDRFFKGFSIEGRFSSSREEQEVAKRTFLAEYATEYIRSSTAVLNEIAGKMVPAEPVDPKAKKKADVPDDVSPEDVKVILVPNPPPDNEEETPEAAAERNAIETLVSGPFPDASAIKPATFQAFVKCFVEGAENPGEITVYEDRLQSAQFDGQRLRCEQLEHVGQAVEFRVPEAEIGALSMLVLINTSTEYAVEDAKWKLIHCEDMPPPAGQEEELPPPPAGKKK